jgi:hypothetical protein
MNEHESEPSLGIADPYLLTLVHMANIGQFSAGVTLTVGGLIVTGDLISGASYFERLSKMVQSESKSLDDESKKSVGEFFLSFGEEYKPDSNQPESKLTPIQFIHIGKARLISHGHKPIDLRLWRGRIDSIDGFTIGTID